MYFKLEIFSVDGRLYLCEAERVTLPTIDGQITVLARHMPIVVPLDVGEVLVKTKEGEIDLSIGKGFFEFSKNAARLLIEDVANSDQISEERALEAKRQAEELLSKGLIGEEKERVVYQLRKSLIDLKIIRRRKRKFLS